MTRAKVLSWCAEHGLFAPGDSVCTALSGGADSVAMLHLLHSLQPELGITLRAAHYNHHLRGAESDRDQQFCRDLCRSLGVELICGEGDVAGAAARTGKSIELAAREMRYAFLDSLGSKIATAHSANDNLETILINLTRGTALRGLCGIPPQREQIVRPILCLTRQEIESYLAEHGLTHITDSTNLQDDCLRNRIRHHIIPALTAENPLLAEKTVGLSEALRRDESYLQAQAGTLLEQARRPEGFDVCCLRAASEPIRTRALRRMLESAGASDLSAAHLRACSDLLFTEDPSAALSLPRLTVRRQYNLLICGGTADGGSFAPVTLPLPGSVTLSNGRTLVCTGPLPYTGSGFCLTLEEPPLVRPRQQGDRLRLPGGSKSLKALMIDRKIPAALREAVPVLEYRGSVIAAYGVGVDLNHKPIPGAPCYQLQIVQNK